MITKEDLAQRVEHLLVCEPDNMSLGLKTALRRLSVPELAELVQHIRDKIDGTAMRWYQLATRSEE